MTDSRKRVDVSVGGFACSLQGFEDPGAALTAILRAMREAGDLALGAPLFDAPTMARLGREIGALAGNGAVSVAPGLVLRWQAGERTVEELGERLDPGADVLGPAAGELAADTLGDATPEPFEAPATSVDASPDMVHPPGTDATPDEVERDGPEASDATAAGETPEDAPQQASHEGLPDAGRTAEAEARVSEPEPDREKPDAPDTPVRDALDVEDTTPAETAGAVEAGADAAEAPAAEGTAPPPSADAGTAQVSDKADEAAGRDEPGPAWKGIAEVSNRSIFAEPEDEPEEAEVADFESSTPLPVEGGDAPAAIEPLEPARQSASVVSIFGEPEEDHATAAGSAADGAQSGARDALDPSIFSDPDAEATATPDAAEGGPDDRSAPLPEPDRTARSIFADPDDPYPDNQEPAHDAREDADVEETVGGSHEATVFSRDDDGDTGSEATAAGIDSTFTDPDGPEPAPDTDEAAGAEQAPTEAAIFAEDEGEAAAVEPGADAEPGSIFGPDEAADEAPTPPDAEAAGERSIFDDPDQEPEEPNIFDDDAEEAEPAPAATPNVFAGEADNVTPLKGRVHEFRRFLRTQTTTDHAVEEIPLRDVSLAEIVKTARAEQVPDLMSVSAAWLSLVKGHRTFTRKEVIAVFEEIEGPHSRSLEAKIKGFGRLLRNGQIQNAEDDRFTLSPRERERYAALIG